MQKSERMPLLGERLALAASFVRPGSAVADIGTDHAYLPIYLIKSGVSVFVIAADINEGPLAHACRNVTRAGVLKNVSIRKSNGLSGIRPGEADDIVIAGMGGELIIRILASCFWIRQPELRLILSPNTKAAQLREWLFLQGFELERERAVRESDKLYTVMQASYTGKISREPLRMYFGGLINHPGELEYAYLEKELIRLKKMMDGFVKKGQTNQLKEFYEIIKGLEKELNAD